MVLHGSIDQTFNGTVQSSGSLSYELGTTTTTTIARCHNHQTLVRQTASFY
jgi:hypothetical protein